MVRGRGMVRGNVFGHLDFEKASLRFLGRAAVARDDTLFMRVTSGDTAFVVLPIQLVVLGPKVQAAVAAGGSADAPREVTQ